MGRRAARRGREGERLLNYRRTVGLHGITEEVGVVRGASVCVPAHLLSKYLSSNIPIYPVHLLLVVAQSAAQYCGLLTHHAALDHNLSDY